MNDLRFAFRQLVKNPGFTAVAVLTLALGIGANTAMFSVVNTLLFRPLPFREPKRLVWIANTMGGAGLSGVTTTVSNFEEWRKLNKSFEDLAAYFAFFDYGSYSLVGMGEPERLRGVGVSQNFLDVLGVRPKTGRGFVDEECKWNGKKAALLTDSFWKRRFGANPEIVGRSITLNDKPTEVVGILPPSFDFASVFSPGSKVDLVVPFPLSQETDNWGNTLAVVGRLKPGVTVEKAQAEFDLINQQMKAAYPERGTTYGAVLTGLQERISGHFRRPVLVLFCAVGFVVLIACTNLANLLLARAASRRKEIAVRIALGASKGRLIRQVLTESVLLACCGAAAGLPLAFGLTHALAASRAFSIPLLQSVTVDGAALLFTLLVAFYSGVLFGIVPALQLSNTNLHDDLKEATRGSSGGRRRTWIRETLIVSEVALACVLLVGAGLLIRSFARLLEVDPGFRAEQALAWRIESARTFTNSAQQSAFYERLVERIEALPGVESAGLTDTLPLGRNRSWYARAKGATYQPGQAPIAFPRIIDQGYIKTMRIPLRAGRDFTSHDTLDSERVLIVNETMARRLWPGKDAIGQVALLGNEWRVVGVVGNVRHSALDEEAGLEMYLPIAQTGASAFELVVRTRLAPSALVPTIRTALKQFDPNLPTADFQTLGQLVEQAVSPKRFVMILLGGFSLLALVLASLGIYGVISYSVSQRTQEIGIRLALGASSRSVLNMIIGEGMKLAAIGIAVGLIASLALTRVMSSLLFGVSATDPLTFVTNSLLLTAVALLACYIPARRATKTDPMEALRYE